MSISNPLRWLAIAGAAGCLSLPGDTLRAQLPIYEDTTPRFPVHGRAEFPAIDRTAGTGRAEQPMVQGAMVQGARVQGAAVPTVIYNHGDPTSEEQYMLELINRARANPAAEGEMLATIDDPTLNAAYDFYNVDRDKLRTDFAKYPARQPLAFNRHLIMSARGHSRDMDTNNFQGHISTDGSRTRDRVKAAGYGEELYVGQNAAAYSYNTLFGHVSLNVDFGEVNQDLGHRVNIMNFKDFIYSEIGIGIVHNGELPPRTGPYVITQDFGRHIFPILLGVVYRDNNGNNFYDPGEGIPGVTIMPSSGEYYAITSASGGYAIPSPTSGEWSVTASGGGLGTPITRTVTFGGENIKLDFKPGMASMPGALTLSAPANDAAIAALTTPLQWEATQGGTGYHLQVSTDSAFSKDMVVNDSALTATSFSLQNLRNHTTYYWRARARNATGWGIFSERRAFRTSVLPSAVTLSTPANGAQVPAGTTEFGWTRGPADITRYWFEFGTDPTMATADIRDSAVTAPQRSVNGLANGSTYYWRVRAYNPAGWGPFSDIWSVSTPTSSVDDATKNGAFELSANTPNPFAGHTVISFELAGAEDVRLTVLDALGNEVGVLASGRREAGRHDVLWEPAAGVANGIYYYQLRAGDVVAARGMVLAR